MESENLDSGESFRLMDHNPMISFLIKREYLPNRIIISTKEMHIYLEPTKY